MPSPDPTKRMVPSRGIRDRYGGISARTIPRWIAQGILPKPDLTINRRDFWWESTLEENERRLVAEKAATKTSA